MLMTFLLTKSLAGHRWVAITSDAKENFPRWTRWHSRLETPALDTWLQVQMESKTESKSNFHHPGQIPTCDRSGRSCPDVFVLHVSPVVVFFAGGCRGAIQTLGKVAPGTAQIRHGQWWPRRVPSGGAHVTPTGTLAFVQI